VSPSLVCGGDVHGDHTIVLGENWVWFDVQAPTTADVAAIEKVFGLHPLTSEDIVEGTREKAEWFDGRACVARAEFGIFCSRV
jgi:Mg2+ and Co2+ transporter CorA